MFFSKVGFLFLAPSLSPLIPCLMPLFVVHNKVTPYSDIAIYFDELPSVSHENALKHTKSRNHARKRPPDTIRIMIRSFPGNMVQAPSVMHRFHAPRYFFAQNRIRPQAH
jgi:hypothetical protein